MPTKLKVSLVIYCFKLGSSYWHLFIRNGPNSRNNVIDTEQCVWVTKKYMKAPQMWMCLCIDLNGIDLQIFVD